MNISYPADKFVTDEDAIQGFIELLQGGFQNPEEIIATVRISVPELLHESFVLFFEETLRVSKDCMDLDVDTTITIPIQTIHKIFKEFEYLDFRDPDIIGAISFEGNLQYANHLSKSCLRPNDATVKRFKEVGKLHTKHNYSSLDVIERINRPSQMQILEVLEQSRPVIISGLEPSPPCRDWTVERLASEYPNSIARVRSATQVETMADFVAELKRFEKQPYDDMLEGFTKPYTEGAELAPELWLNFGPLFFDREDFVPPQLWLGAVPTHIPTSTLHRDILSGFLLQVIGRKRLDLYSADQAELLYPHSAFNNYQPCWFKPEKPDFARYPLAEKAQCISVILNPGELLVQPAGWFHQVYALDSPNMSVSYFWRY